MKKLQRVEPSNTLRICETCVSPALTMAMVLECCVHRKWPNAGTIALHPWTSHGLYLLKAQAFLPPIRRLTKRKEYISVFCDGTATMPLSPTRKARRGKFEGFQLLFIFVFSLYSLNPNDLLIRPCENAITLTSFIQFSVFYFQLVSSSPRRPCDERMENVLHRRRQFRLVQLIKLPLHARWCSGDVHEVKRWRSCAIDRVSITKEVLKCSGVSRLPNRTKLIFFLCT